MKLKEIKITADLVIAGAGMPGICTALKSARMGLKTALISNRPYFGGNGSAELMIMIVGASGKGGGYSLCRKPEEYTIGEILELMEGPLSSVACLAGETNDCPRKSVCHTLPMWTEYDQMVHDFFYGKKLSDLLKGQTGMR